MSKKDKGQQNQPDRQKKDDQQRKPMPGQPDPSRQQPNNQQPTMPGKNRDMNKPMDDEESDQDINKRRSA